MFSATTPTAWRITNLFDAVELLAEIGYRGVAITIDHHALSPKPPRHHRQQIRRGCAASCSSGSECDR